MRTCWLIWPIVLAAAAVSQAAENCPWLNSATAGGIIGSPVTLSTLRLGEKAASGSCRYVHALPHGEIVLTIYVQTMSDVAKDFRHLRARCVTAPTALRAIGNQAVSCAGKEKGSRLVEQVIGRVRQQGFVIRVSSSEAEAVRSTLAEQAHTVAEHVAGMLF